MSYNSYRTSSAPSRGRGFSSRGSFRGRGGGDGSNSSWNSTSPRGGRGGFSGPSRGRFNWYKEHGSSSFDSRRSYGSGGFTGGADRYSSRGGRAEESYRRSYRGDVSDYSPRDHSHHRSPESQRKRMRTEHSYVQASSGRRSHEGSYGGGTDYNSRYSYDDKGYGEDRSRGYRDERRSAGSFRDRSREEYPHRKADHLDSGMPPPSGGPPRHMSSPRGSYRGRVSSRGTRGMSRLTLARRADAILARKRSFMDSYSVSKRILTSRAKADFLRRLKIQKLRRIRDIAAKREGKGDKDGKGSEDISEDDEEEDGELGEMEDWETEMKKEPEEDEDDEAGEKSEEKSKAVKKVKKIVKEEEREEGEEVDEEEEAEGEEEEEAEEEKGGEKAESSKKSDAKNGGVHVTIKQDSDTRAVSDEIKRTTLHGKPYIRLTCPHCFRKCITFKEYAFHLYSSKHINAMRKQSLRLKQTLARMRMTQRQKQRIVEENEAAQGTLSSRTRFCPTCKLNYRQFKTKHQLSRYHRAMKKFLMPFCSVCRICFKSPMLYENHICSLDHIRREAHVKETMRLRERAKDDGSEDEDKEVNLENFMTLDSVGTVDDDGEEEGSEGEGKSKDKDKKEGDEKKRTEANLGSEFIKKVEVLFCEICRTYLPRLDQPERALSIHCRSRPHLTRYVRYRDDRNLRREAERLHQHKEGKDGDGEKSSEKKKEPANEKMVDSTTEKEAATNGDIGTKVKEGGADASQKMTGVAGGKTRRDTTEGGEDIDQELEAGMDDKLWADVDKDLGDLLREVEPGNKSSDEDEDSRAEGGRYDRFRYSEKGSSGTGPNAEGDAPDTTKTTADGDGEGESETAEGDSAKNSKSTEGKDETVVQSKNKSPSGGTASSTPASVTTN